MLDINFYMKFDQILEDIEKKEITDKEQLFGRLEDIRSKEPVIYNIETTNRCNMRCKMCPRTTMMTRKIEDIDRETFLKVVDQIKPHSEEDWNKWKEYCEKKYGIKEDDEASENHFFLYIISKVIQLHGYGDPLLDKNIVAKYFYKYFIEEIPAFADCLDKELITVLQHSENVVNLKCIGMTE